ncbi:MAG: translation elongation factor Ts [Clostridiaceae bacterium]|jgi:elongation factor Ts|nr:translation elongation factor Ts [Clostridiaceae bacterium]
MQISASMVKDLRDRTGAGMMDCKKALAETNGDIEKAIEYLREKGIAKAANKAGRIATEGIVESYIHGGGRIGVLVEVNIETDFAAKNEDFRAFVKDIAMQIAAMKPLYVKREDVPAEQIEKEKEILKAQAINEGKPANIAEKIVNGRIEKYFTEICLLEQSFIKDSDKTVEQVLKEKIAAIGENITIRRFARFEMGEGLEKKEENFADEVMKQIK